MKWLPPIGPPKDPKLHDVWRIYETGRWLYRGFRVKK